MRGFFDTPKEFPLKRSRVHIFRSNTMIIGTSSCTRIHMTDDTLINCEVHVSIMILREW